MDELYIGIMSGTSLNGADAVLLGFADKQMKLLQTHTESFPENLYDALQQLITTQQTSLSQLGDIDHDLAVIYSLAVKKLIHNAGVSATQVRAIGCHGQTVYHHPDGPRRNSLQLGDPSFIAEATGINVVADLRRRDMAAAGQGAPMVPGFHAAAFRSAGNDRVILNIGGIANITILPSDHNRPVTGFDTGPGNTLLDQWARRDQYVAYDKNGEWAAGGRVIGPLLDKLLTDAYFGRNPPKSTGREYFNLPWLEQHVGHNRYLARDIQATLLELTCQSIVHATKEHARHTIEVYVCGGGAHNQQMMQRLSQLMSPATVQTTSVLGIEPDWVEAAAFAWLARQTMHKQAGNLMSVTGAKRPVILGGIYQSDG